MIVDRTRVLRTPRLVLRTFEQEDLDALHAIRSREDVNRYLYDHPLSRDETAVKLATRIERYSTLAEPGDALLLAVALRRPDGEAGEVIGDVNLHWQHGDHRQAEVGYVLHPDHAGRGFATEATRPLVDLAFAELGVHRVCGRLDGRNAASARVLEKLGMRREAQLRENEYVKGEWTDEVVYAVLAREWDGAASS
ncbi:GNAT family N-acetyltransferase [Prauserella alba]|uniref:GNAT family protein n=1 Tax=Prauserella alba TaxID=176898 RepID=A0ABP4GDY0_9PSEU|nr:GNAT family N-acetyltransferase [Prauserella alba]MCP2183739.1 Protein N-acetyltransferase, RimJ/RimL family [Prauserella alba]